ncbi:hypothetical protein Ctob_016405 [Chrysochromulina tobinii]|uniref:Uncharacterized protein n=1 Tax=Chrysochromulina tobinii TaxID=1460289 RepID=A0A0M0KAR9_9EUKA|nr:hypothetical protein Ctob_016405 [Chrysochromulina tobinii]|eukprot:KOO35894.1 hypothetical protein Ctob_016405 [Chrysochromulina sp. CCMP291]
MMLASALVMPATVLTWVCEQVETEPETSVRVVGQEQTVAPLALTLGPSVAELEKICELMIETLPKNTMLDDSIVTVPLSTRTPPPHVAVFPLMVHDEMATVPPSTKTPPPPEKDIAVLPVMVHDEKVTVPPWT